MSYETYYTLLKHVFVEDVFKKGTAFTNDIVKSGHLKSNPELKREPYEHEFYCMELSFYLSHLLTVVHQMEHTILYMSNFSPTESMKKAGVNRSTHLLWSVENYIIRTQSVYDRLLIIVDRLFHIQNQPNRISHESIVTNKHISRSSIPDGLKPVKAAVKKYYHDRNTIIHESSYLDDGLRWIEAYTILSSYSGYDDFFDKDLTEELKVSVKIFIRKRKLEFSRINKNVCISLGDLFSKMHPIFIKKYKELSS